MTASGSQPELKGPAAEGVALKIRRTPQGEETGVSRATHHALQNLCVIRQAPPPLPPAPPDESQKFHFSCFNFSKLSYMQNLQNLRKWTPTETLFGSKSL